MDRILGSRGTGKTKQLMYLAARNNGIFVSANPKAMRVKARDYGIEMSEDQFASYHDLIEPMALGHRKLYIDEVDGLLQYINPNISGYNLGLD
jgi:hypothetical protein